jgi:hypothetical protein
MNTEEKTALEELCGCCKENNRPEYIVNNISYGGTFAIGYYPIVQAMYRIAAINLAVETHDLEFIKKCKDCQYKKIK